MENQRADNILGDEVNNVGLVGNGTTLIRATGKKRMCGSVAHG